jgi:uncharacterized protein YjiS (DUF1127 family)
MTMISANCPAAHCTPISTRLSVFDKLLRVHTVWRQRQTLKSMDATTLSDIGVTRAEANAEAIRPIWDAPNNWKR